MAGTGSNHLLYQQGFQPTDNLYYRLQEGLQRARYGDFMAALVLHTTVILEQANLIRELLQDSRAMFNKVIENSQAIKTLENKTTALERQFLEQNLNFRDVPNCAPPPPPPPSCNIYPQVGEPSVHIMCGPARGDQPPLLSLARMTQSQRIETVYPYQRPSLMSRPPPRPPEGYPGIPPNFIPHHQTITQYAFPNNSPVFPSQRPFGIVTHAPRIYPPPTSMQMASSRLPIAASGESVNGTLSTGAQPTAIGNASVTPNSAANGATTDSQPLPVVFPHLVLPEGITIIPLGPAKTVDKSRMVKEPLSKTLQPSVVIQAIEDRVSTDANNHRGVIVSSRKRLVNPTRIGEERIDIIPFDNRATAAQENAIDVAPSVEDLSPPIKRSTQKGLNLDRLLQKITELSQNRSVTDSATTIASTNTSSVVPVQVGSRRRKSLSKPVREKPRQHFVETIYEDEGEFEEEFPEIAEIAFRDAMLCDMQESTEDFGDDGDRCESERGLPVIVSVKGSADTDNIANVDGDETQQVVDDDDDDDTIEHSLSEVLEVNKTNEDVECSAEFANVESNGSFPPDIEDNDGQSALFRVNDEDTSVRRDDNVDANSLCVVEFDEAVKELVDDMVTNIAPRLPTLDGETDGDSINESPTVNLSSDLCRVKELNSESLETAGSETLGNRNEIISAELNLEQIPDKESATIGQNLCEESPQSAKGNDEVAVITDAVAKQSPKRRSQRKKTRRSSEYWYENHVSEDDVAEGDGVHQKQTTRKNSKQTSSAEIAHPFDSPDDRANVCKKKTRIPAKKNKFSIWSSMGYRTRKKKRKSRLRNAAVSDQNGETPDERGKKTTSKNCSAKASPTKEKALFWAPLYRKSIRLSKTKQPDSTELEMFSLKEKETNNKSDANNLSVQKLDGNESVIDPTISPVIIVGKVTRSMQSQLDALNTSKSVFSDLNAKNEDGEVFLASKIGSKRTKKKNSKGRVKKKNKSRDSNVVGSVEKGVACTQNILTRNDALTAVSALENVETCPPAVRTVVQDLVEITHLREQAEVEEACLSDSSLNFDGNHGISRAVTLTRAIRIWQEHDYSRFPIEVLKSTDDTESNVLQGDAGNEIEGNIDARLRNPANFPALTTTTNVDALPSTSSSTTKAKPSRRVARKSICSSCRDCSSIGSPIVQAASSSNFQELNAPERSESANIDADTGSSTKSAQSSTDKDGKNVDSGESLKHSIRSKLQTKLRTEAQYSSAADSEDDYACLLKTFVHKRSVLSEKNAIVPPATEQNVNIKTIKHRLSFAIAEGLVTTFAEEDETSSLQPQVQCVNIFSIHEIWKYLKCFINDSTRTVLALHQLGQKEIQQFLVLARLCFLDAHQDDNDLYFEKAEYTQDLTVEMLEKAIKVLEETNGESE